MKRLMMFGAVLVVAALAAGMGSGAAKADDSTLGQFLCHRFRNPTPPDLGQCVRSLNVEGGTYAFLTVSDYQGTTVYYYFDGSGHLVRAVVSTPAEQGARLIIRTPDSSVVETLIVPVGATGGTLDLSNDPFYAVKDGDALLWNWDDSFGGI